MDSGNASRSCCSPLRALFDFYGRDDTTFVQEIKAGMTTFVTLSYIVLLNAKLLGMAGVVPEDCVLGTTIASGLASILAGIFGNLPFACAPGLGLSAYLGYGLVQPEIQTKQQALTCCMIAGLLLVLCAVTRLSHAILQLVPRSVKLGAVVGMGLQLSLIGLIFSGLVVAKEDSLVALGDLSNYVVWVFFFGLLLTGTLLYFQVPGSMLIGISVCSVWVWAVEDSWPAAFVQWPELTVPITDNVSLTSLSPSCISAVLALLVIDLIDISGTTFGLGNLARVMDVQGNVARSAWGFVGCGLGTMAGAVFGCSPINIGIESAAGIKQGGRTGLASVVAGLLLLGSAFLAPLLGSIPEQATAPILVLVGGVMMSETRNIIWREMAHAIPAYITIMMMAFTFSVANGIWFGMGSAVVLYFTTGDFLLRFPFNRRRYSSVSSEQTISPLIDDVQGAIRHPAMLISKEEADKYDIDTYEAARSKAS